MGALNALELKWIQYWLCEVGHKPDERVCETDSDASKQSGKATTLTKVTFSQPHFGKGAPKSLQFRSTRPEFWALRKGQTAGSVSFHDGASENSRIPWAGIRFVLQKRN